MILNVLLLLMFSSGIVQCQESISVHERMNVWLYSGIGFLILTIVVLVLIFSQHLIGHICREFKGRRKMMEAQTTTTGYLVYDMPVRQMVLVGDFGWYSGCRLYWDGGMVEFEVDRDGFGVSELNGGRVLGVEFGFRCL